MIALLLTVALTRPQPEPALQPMSPRACYRVREDVLSRLTIREWVPCWKCRDCRIDPEGWWKYVAEGK